MRELVYTGDDGMSLKNTRPILESWKLSEGLAHL